MTTFFDFILAPHYRMLTESAENSDIYYKMYFDSNRFSNDFVYTYAAIEATRIALHGVIEECE